MSKYVDDVIKRVEERKYGDMAHSKKIFINIYLNLVTAFQLLHR